MKCLDINAINDSNLNNAENVLPKTTIEEIKNKSVAATMIY